MRLQYLAFALMWIIAPGSGWSQPATTSDTVLRAAYCVGVLDQSVSGLKGLPRTDQCALHKDGQCWVTEKEMAETFDEVLGKKQEQRRMRYAQYLAMQLPNLDKMRTSIAAVIAKGKTDYENFMNSGSGAMHDKLSKCGKMCGDTAATGTSQCSIECIAQQDQVLANIWKCMTRPDQLPF